MDSPSRNLLRPTCARCRTRKVRCDGRMPRCSPCQQANVDCVVSSTVSSGRYDRQYVESLQERVGALQKRDAEVRGLLESERRRLGELEPAVAMPAVNVPEDSATPSFPDPSPGESTVVNDHGMGFIDLIFAKIRSEVVKSRATSTWPKHHDRPTIAHSTSAPVSVDSARSLFETYIRRSHSRYPFLDLAGIEALRDTVLQTLASASPDIHLSTEESFRAYAIMATAAVYQNQELSVLGMEDHRDEFIDPIDLFSVSVKEAGQVNLLHGITGIQNLLLITRFRFFHAIGASLWDLSSLNMRTCIGCNLHRKPEAPLPAFEEQMQRRVFWQCYGPERFASTTLGRPFGIPDEAITVKLPVNVDDAVLKAAATLHPNASLDELAETQLRTNCLTSMSLGLSHIQLRRITSHVFHDFGRLRHRFAKCNSSESAAFDSLEILTLRAEIWDTYYQYLNQLLAWKSNSRIHATGTVSDLGGGGMLLTDGRWIDLHFHQEKLLLIRLSIKSSPNTPSSFIDPIDLLDELYDSASNVIVLYSQVAGDAKVEPTAGRLYRVLTAGLSILYTIIIDSQVRDEEERRSTRKDAPRPASPHNHAIKRSMLRLCTDTLDRMAGQVTAQQLTPKYVGYFDLLCREVLRNIPKELNEVGNEPYGGHGPEQPPDNFSSDLITAQLTCQRPQEHMQPCYCTVYGHPAGQTNILPDAWSDPSPDMLLGYDYEPGMLVSEWENSAIWEALFGDYQDSIWTTPI